jgi:hypothetical protein
MSPHIRIVPFLLLLFGATFPSALHAQQPRIDVAGEFGTYEVLIEEHVVSEIYPLLPFLFFDSASAGITDRYIRFAAPEQTAGFADSTIPGGTFEKYYHLLNIVGYRLRRHPDATIVITDPRSPQENSGEPPQLAVRREQAVRDYLVNIWNIDSARIRLARPRDMRTANPGDADSLRLQEHRRIEIASNDWEIMKPVVNVDVRRYPQPDSVRFRMKNGMENTRVARRAVEIRRGGNMWRVIDIPPGDSISPGFDWRRGDDPDTLPNDATPFIAQLVVYDVDGIEHRSENLQIPVRYVNIDTIIRYKLIDKIVKRFWISFFTPGAKKLGPVNERAIRDFICGIIRPGAEIESIGFADVADSAVGAGDIAASRAGTVNDFISGCVAKQWGVAFSGRGAGKYLPPYPTDFPEGRCYNRAVVVTMTMPLRK